LQIYWCCSNLIIRFHSKDSFTIGQFPPNSRSELLESGHLTPLFSYCNLISFSLSWVNGSSFLFSCARSVLFSSCRPSPPMSSRFLLPSFRLDRSHWLTLFSLASFAPLPEILIQCFQAPRLFFRHTVSTFLSFLPFSSPPTIGSLFPRHSCTLFFSLTLACSINFFQRFQVFHSLTVTETR